MPRLTHLALAGALLTATAAGQTEISNERLLNAAKEPANWLMYGSDYASNRYSRLAQITPANVTNLNLKWVYQSPVAGSWEATPLVVEGVMYITQRPNDVFALDAATGRVFWIFRYNSSADPKVCCGANNRGLAILGGTLYMGTLDSKIVAIDAKTGQQLWKTTVADPKAGYSITVAPQVVKDKVIIGVGGG